MLCGAEPGLAEAHSVDGINLGAGKTAPWSVSGIQLDPLLLLRLEAQAASLVSGLEYVNCLHVVAAAVVIVAEAAAYGSSPRTVGVWAGWRRGPG